MGSSDCHQGNMPMFEKSSHIKKKTAVVCLLEEKKTFQDFFPSIILRGNAGVLKFNVKFLFEHVRRQHYGVHGKEVL